MVKRLINILIFAFIFFLYFVSFLLIYDTFREKKLKSLEGSALDKFDSIVKIQKQEKPEESGDDSYEYEPIDYSGYTILGKIEIPEIGFTSIILKEYTYNAMNIGVIKTYGPELNEKGGFVIAGHNYRGRSIFMFNIRYLGPGDKIYITDTSGRILEYTVYQTLREVDPNDGSYFNDYDGYHVTLVTCENSGRSRIVVKARVE